MKPLFYLLAIYYTLSISGCVPSESASTERLLLKSGFEDGVSISEDLENINGADYPGYSWDDTLSWIKSSRFAYIVGDDKQLNEFMESAIESQLGPSGDSSKVLRLTNIKDDPDHSATSRNEFSFFGKDAPYDYQEGYVRYWMKLQDNLDQLIPYQESSPFYMIMEWKEPNSKVRWSADECDSCCQSRPGGTNNYRININLQKDANSSNLYWLIRGEQPQPCRIEEWRYDNREVPVPVGEWFLVEAYMKKHTTEGRVYFAINEQVVLDTDQVQPEGFSDRTTHIQNPMRLQFWSPMKNYHGMRWNHAGPVSQWYDDIEIWNGFPTGHPALTHKKNKL